nr:IS30 family transposase [Actinomadura terrae]
MTLHEREEISRGIASGVSGRAIARRLNLSASTVDREVRRNGGREPYRALDAEDRASSLARRPKPAELTIHPSLRQIVEERLECRWSPQQIACWLPLAYPDQPSMRVSHETIYLSLFDPRRRALNRTLTGRLRTGRTMRHPRVVRRPSGRGQIRDMVPISQRPAEVETRLVPGHWEGDLVMDKRPSAVATLVERTSRLVRLVALPDGLKAHQVRPHLVRAIEQMPSPMRGSLTWDRGREMADHAQLTAQTGMPVYFCRRRSPWQRGTNENTNGLLRQYLGKSADIRLLDQPPCACARCRRRSC